MSAPTKPKIYHILHMDKLASVIADGCLWSDAIMMTKGNLGTTIGMTGIKERRLKVPFKDCHPSIHVGECVPFYFCPRSVMLYLIYRANHDDLGGGQGPIIHLEADLLAVVAWADRLGRRWTFSLSNAGAYYVEFRSNLDQLGEVNWLAVHSNDFR
jgi:hypothetical protein